MSKHDGYAFDKTNDKRLCNTVGQQHPGSAIMNLINLFNNEQDITTVKEGDTIFSEGDAGDAMYVVVEGLVALSVRGHQLDLLEPGELFGEMALIDAGPRSATATAKSDSRIARVDERRFTFLVQETPFFALHVMRVLARRLRNMDDTLH